ncbi:hypothetical protein N7456_008602 [Penicillium angulare]|uniref:Uncharacterized protein n=1 Tax=Penicillium angulare TaxID=116970 RepID=A0A9W9F3D7_9EURO|nr:hypothetical protein N7456_008602 [Penicillium angulare]
MEIESQPFLPPTADDKQQPNICPECHIGCHSRFSTGKLILWVGTAILFNAIALMFIAVRSDKGIPAAAYAATRHEGISGIQLRYFIKSTDYVQTPYFGEPGETTDAAWDELLGDMFIRATSEELAAANQSSITLPGGSENLAWLGVSHDLHCINSIRQSIYRDHYYPNVTAKEANKLRSHSGKCH